jgi:hypothetical protein
MSAVTYFNLGMVASVLLGGDVYSIYYDLSWITAGTVTIVLIINVFYVLLTALFLKMIMPETLRVSVISSWSLLFVAISTIIYFNIGGLQLERTEIKSNSNIISVIGTSISYSYMAAVFLCETNRLKLLVASMTLIFSITASFEREVILYLLVPLVLRLDAGTFGLFKVGITGALGVLTLTIYKTIMSLFRLSHGFSLDALGQIQLWLVVQHSLMRDNLHKGSIELSFFGGTSPEYSRYSYWMPVQIERILVPGAKTNGQLATEYYTDGMTGTGFSAILEAWLNLGALGILVLPLTYALLMRRVLRTGSALMLLTMCIFLVKLQRSDLWPTFIGILLGPLMWMMVIVLKRATARRAAIL